MSAFADGKGVEPMLKFADEKGGGGYILKLFMIDNCASTGCISQLLHDPITVMAKLTHS